MNVSVPLLVEVIYRLGAHTKTVALIFLRAVLCKTSQLHLVIIFVMIMYYYYYYYYYFFIIIIIIIIIIMQTH